MGIVVVAAAVTLYWMTYPMFHQTMMLLIAIAVVVVVVAAAAAASTWNPVALKGEPPRLAMQLIQLPSPGIFLELLGLLRTIQMFVHPFEIRLNNVPFDNSQCCTWPYFVPYTFETSHPKSFLLEVADSIEPTFRGRLQRALGRLLPCILLSSCIRQGVHPRR
jgi:hypothetical protein